MKTASAGDATLMEEYRRVLAIVRSDRYRKTSAREQREILWQAVSRTPFDVLPPIEVSLIENVRQILNRRVMRAAFDGEDDVRPPRKKAFHPFGTVAKVRLNPVPGHPYTGLFASGTLGLARLSLARAEATFSRRRHSSSSPAGVRLSSSCSIRRSTSRRAATSSSALRRTSHCGRSAAT